MPDLLHLDRDSQAPEAGSLETLPGGPPTDPPPGTALPRTARKDLRRQIAALERELGELFTSSGRKAAEIEWGTGGIARGPRMLSLGELEEARDRLAHRLAEARGDLAERADRAEAKRGLLERMLADPAEHKWVRINNDDLDEAGCKHYHSRPRWGIIGAFIGWWRVKLSSGCPLATGCR